MYPEGPEMDDILVATAARPQACHFDETLGERQQQTPIPNQRGRGEPAGVIKAAGDGWCQADLGISLKGVESSLRG